MFLTGNSARPSFVFFQQDAPGLVFTRRDVSGLQVSTKRSTSGIFLLMERPVKIYGVLLRKGTDLLRGISQVAAYLPVGRATLRAGELAAM